MRSWYSLCMTALSHGESACPVTFKDKYPPSQCERSFVVQARIHDLEIKNFSVNGDLQKTVNLYKECFSQLQKAETQ